MNMRRLLPAACATAAACAALAMHSPAAGAGSNTATTTAVTIPALRAPSRVAAALPAGIATRLVGAQPVVDASTLPHLSDIASARGATTNAVDDTLLLQSVGFDALDGSCNSRGWGREDRSSNIFAHVDSRFVVNEPVARAYAASLTLPAAIAGTAIQQPFAVTTDDSSHVLYAEAPGGRIVELYAAANLMRLYAAMPAGAQFAFAADHATGGTLIVAGNSSSCMLYRVPAGGGTAVAIAGNPGGVAADTTAADALIQPIDPAVVTDHAGNIYFTDGYRVRMLRVDGRVVTVAGSVTQATTGDGGDLDGPAADATFQAPGSLALDAGDAHLYVLDRGAERVRVIDLAAGTIAAVVGYQPQNYPIGQAPTQITLDGSRLLVGVTPGGVLDLSQPASQQAVVGFGNDFAPAGANLAAGQPFHVSSFCARPGGGVVFLDGDRNAVLAADATDHLLVLAGNTASVLMGARALWFGADMTTAPADVANWVIDSGYGSGWDQRLTSPSFSFAAHPHTKFTFDAHLTMDADQTQVIELTSFNCFVAVRALAADGTWRVVGSTARTVFGPASGNYYTGSGVVQLEADLTGFPAGPTTRLQIVMQTSRQDSYEDGQVPPIDGGGVVVDNLRVTDGADVLPPVDFEDGTTGGWTLSAHNGAYASVLGDHFVRDDAPPQSQIRTQSGFDFADPSCVWSFTAAGDTLPAGTYARLTSPWIALADPQAPAYLTFSGKLSPKNDKCVLSVLVRGKNAGDTRPVFVAHSTNAFTSGTSGGDLVSPFLDQVTLAYPNDFTNPAGTTVVDSIQVLYEIQDRKEELQFAIPTPIQTSKLPYLDDLHIYQRSGDDDHDGVPNAIDACPAVSSAGRDPSGSGCPVATATLRHVESWSAASLPIHFRISSAGDPAIHDGSDKAAIRAAVNTWKSVAGANVQMVEDAETAQTNAAALDGVNLITFEDDLQFSPDVLAITPTTSFTRRDAFDDRLVLPGQIVDSDLIFNPAAQFSTPTSPVAGAVDLQSVATHEIGHMLGLSHSGAIDATMYPVLQDGTGAASLTDDDRAAIGAAYPAASYATDFGAITGTVARGVAGGAPVPGALVTAWVLVGGNPDHVASSDYSDELGAFALRGLAAGSYDVRVDPLDGSIPGLVPEAVNERVMTIAQTNFQGEWFSSPETGAEDPALRAAVAVTAGGATPVALVTPRDVTPPTIASVLPADVASGVGIDGRVLVNFSEPIDGSTIGGAFSLRVTGQPGRLGGSGSLLNANKTFVFTPSFPLLFDTDYEIQIAATLTDRQGNALAAPFVAHFHTMPTPSVAIFDIVPRQAPPGALITIRGQGFGDTGNPVSVSIPVVGGTSVRQAATSATSTVVNLPPDALSGPIVVTANGVDSNPFNYTVSPAGKGVPVASGLPVALPFSPSDVAVSPEGNSVFAISGSGFASINLSPTRPLFRAADVEPLTGGAQIGLSVDGLRAYVTRPDSSDLVEFVTDTTHAGFGHLHRTIPLPGRPGGMCVAPDGSHVFVPEQSGSRIWVVDVDPSSATFRGIVSEMRVPGVTLEGGAALGGLISTTRAQRTTSRRAGRGAAVTAAGPRTRINDGAPFSNLFLDSDSGLLAFYLGNDSTYAQLDATPCAGKLLTTVDGGSVVGAGAGALAGSLVIGCLPDGCPPGTSPLALGGTLRGFAVSPRDGSVLIANGAFNQLQVISNLTTGALAGQVSTGRTPVAVATSADGGVTAVANAGDRSIGLYRITTATELSPATASVGMPGDVLGAVLASGFSTGFDVELGATSIAPGYRRDAGAAFTVPALAPQTTSILLGSATTRTTPQPFRIVDRITAFTPHAAGPALALPFICVDSTSQRRIPAIGVSPDGRTFAEIMQIPTCNSLNVYQLRDDAPEPVFTQLGDSFTLPHFTGAHAGVYTAEGRRFWVPDANGLHFLNVDPTDANFGDPQLTAGGFIAFAVAADPLGPLVAVSLVDPNSPATSMHVDFYDGNDGSELGPLFSVPDTARTLAYTPDGRLLVVGGQGRLLFFDIANRVLLSGSPTTQHAGVGPALAVTVTSDGHRAIAAFLDGSVGVFSTDPANAGTELYFGKPLATAHVSGLVPAPNGTGAIASCGDGPLAMIDAATIPPTVTTGGPSNATALARTPDGRHLLLLIPGDATHDDSTLFVSLSPATSATLVSGGNQEALAGAELPIPVRVRFADAADRPQSGVLVRFSLAGAAQGALDGALSVERYTDVDGQAAASWTMPATPGAVTLSVSAPGLPVPPLAVGATATGNPTSAAPQLVTLGPASGAVGVAAGTEVFAHFSQAMGDSAAVAPYVSLRIGNDALPGTLRFEDGGRTVFFKPQQPLPYLALATLRVASGMPDAYGHTLATGGSSTFTVQAEPSLTIVTVSPPAGRPGTAVTLNGQGFSPVATLDQVTFNGVLAPVLNASSTSLVMRVPALSSTGPIVVRVGPEASNGAPFVVLPDSAGPGAVVDTLPTARDPLRLIVTPDGRRAYVVSPRQNQVAAIDVFAAEQIALIPVGANPRGITMLPDGSRAYVANYDGNDVSVIGTDPDSADTYHHVVATIPVGHNPTDIAVLAGGPRVIVLNKSDSTASIIDAQRGNATFDHVTKNIPLPASGGSITISPDGTRAFITTGAGVSVLDLASLVVKNIPLPAAGGSVTISPDGGLLFVITADNKLVVIDVSPTSSSPNRVVATIPLPAGGKSVTISPDGTELFVVLSDNNTVIVFDVRTGAGGAGGSSSAPGPAVTLTPADTLVVGDAPAGAASDPFGNFLLVANEGSGTLSLIQTSNAAPDVDVTYPNGGETLLPGSVAHLTWETNGIRSGQTVRLRLSRDLGQNWETLADSIPNSGDFPWTVTGPNTGAGAAAFTALLEVSSTNVFGRTGRDSSDHPFAISDVVTATELLMFRAEPKAGGVEVAWEFAPAADVRDVAVERATDAAGPWSRIAAAPTAAGRGFVAVDASAAPGHTYQYRLAGTTTAGAPITFGPVTATMPITAFSLSPIAPNPSRGAVTIEYAVAREARVRLSVIDVAGREVAKLAAGMKSAGLYHVRWPDASRRAPAGLYFVRYEAGGKTFVRRVALTP